MPPTSTATPNPVAPTISVTRFHHLASAATASLIRSSSAALAAFWASVCAAVTLACRASATATAQVASACALAAASMAALVFRRSAICSSSTAWALARAAWMSALSEACSREVTRACSPAARPWALPWRGAAGLPPQPQSRRQLAMSMRIGRNFIMGSSGIRSFPQGPHGVKSVILSSWRGSRTPGFSSGLRWCRRGPLSCSQRSRFPRSP